MRTLEEAISHMMNPKSSEVVDLKTAVEDVVLWEKEMRDNPCPGGGGLGFAMDEVRAAGKADPQGVWGILRNGTDDEFSALCNCLPEIGGEFDDDEALREIMSIAKRRLAEAQNCDDLMAGIKGGYGCLFDKFWNETPPVQKARTFNQIIQNK